MAKIKHYNRKIILLDPNLKTLFGHYLSYAAAIKTAAKASSIGLLVMGNKNVDASASRKYNIDPVFSYDIWENITPPDYFSEENIERNNRIFYSDAKSGLDKSSLDADDIVFYPNNIAGQLQGIAAIIADLQGRRIRHEIMLRYPASFYRGSSAKDAFRSLERLSRTELVRLSTDSHRLVYDLGVHTDLPIALMPIPHTITKSTKSALANKPKWHVQNIWNDARSAICVALKHFKFWFPSNSATGAHVVSLGNARGEKGILEIFEAIRLSRGCPLLNTWRFTIQINDPTPDVAAAIAALRNEPDDRVNLIDKSLNISEYRRLLESSDIVLTPYYQDIYLSRTSGIYLEAAAAGKITLGTENTWIADLIAKHGGGVLVEDRSPKSIFEQLKYVGYNFVALKREAINASREILALHNPTNFIECLLNAKEIPNNILGKRRVAIFYPWDDLKNKTGAGQRVSMLAMHLAEHGREVKILCLGQENFRMHQQVSVESYDNKKWHESELAQESFLQFAKYGEYQKWSAVHYYYHILSRSDRDFAIRCNRLVYWADDILVEYTYFADVIDRIAGKCGKTFSLTAYDLVSEAVHKIPLLYTSVQHFELLAFKLASFSAIANEREADVLRKKGVTIEVIPNPTDCEICPSTTEDFAAALLREKHSIVLDSRVVIVFVGSEFYPNKAAASKVREIASVCLAAEETESFLFVVAGTAHQAERTENFVALGRIDDLDLKCLYRVASFALVPLESGTGASIKTLEALANSCCVVSTTVGARGYPVIDNYHCIIEDDFLKYPSIIQMISGDLSKLKSFQDRGREFALQYDYRKLFYLYGLTNPDENTSILSKY